MYKYILFFFGALFLYFAYVQLNDPDPLKWLTIYCLTGLLPIAMMYIPKAKYGIYLLIGVLVALFIWGFPDMMDWANKGFPSITGTMKAESQHIELVREFLGIFICLLYLVPVLLASNKQRTKNG